VIISDYNAVAELIHHGIAADLAQAAALALKAGVDIDMMADAYRKGMPAALERGLVTMDEVDIAVRRVLRLKEALGLFDDPYRRGKTESAATLAKRRKLSREAGVRSIVMLKNDNGALPLEGVLRVALIGPLADAGAEMRGPWWGAGEKEPHVSVAAGLRALRGIEVAHAPGCDIRGDDDSGIAAAVELCEQADAVVLCLGEAANMSGEAASRAYPELPGRQQQLADAVCKRARSLKRRVIAILFSGRPLVVPALAAKADALLAAWFPGTEAGNAIADVLTGRMSPGGRTPMTWPRAIGQIPVFFGARPSGRPDNPSDFFTSKYLDVPNAPLYPFGHGLTYGRFTLANLRVTPGRVAQDDRIEVRVDVTNEGQRAAEETVFLFTRDKVASVARPLLELRGFAKIALEPGATGTVEISMAAAELRFLGLDLEPVFEPGEVEILVGPCADRAQLIGASVQLIV